MFKRTMQDNEPEQFLDKKYILDFVKGIFIHAAMSSNGKVSDCVSNTIAPCSLLSMQATAHIQQE